MLRDKSPLSFAIPEHMGRIRRAIPLSPEGARAPVLAEGAVLGVTMLTHFRGKG